MLEARNIVRAGLRILRNRAGLAARPVYCTYLVTMRCNARCGMCDSWRVKPGPELSVEEAISVVQKLGPLLALRLTGGEPFLREDFVELALGVFAASRPEVLHLTTNGSFPDRLEELLDRFPDPSRLRVMVSLDGLPEVHDENRGKEVTFALAERSLERLLLAKKRGVHVAVNHTVISKESLADAERLRARFESRGVDVQTVLAYADSSMYTIKLRGKRAEHLIVPSGYPLHPALSDSDVVGFVENELRASETIADPFLRLGKRYYLRGLLERLRGEEVPSLKPDCVALRSHIRLLPDGRVPVCQFNTETIGSLKTRTLDDVYDSNEVRRARAWVDACPGCWAECEVMPNAIFTGDLARALV